MIHVKKVVIDGGSTVDEDKMMHIAHMECDVDGACDGPESGSWSSESGESGPESGESGPDSEPPIEDYMRCMEGQDWGQTLLALATGNGEVPDCAEGEEFGMFLLKNIYCHELKNFVEGMRDEGIV